jgi:hypothetical protein
MSGYIPDSISVNWCTPDEVVEAVHETFEGPPDIDPCSNKHSRIRAKVEFSLENGYDGLVDRWPGLTAYINHPFGKGWWRPRPHQPQCNQIEVRHGPPYCACGSARRRDYIWPADRKNLTKEQLKQYKPVGPIDWLKRAADFGLEAKDPPAASIGLTPAYPGTKAFQTQIWKRATRVFFPEGRLHFRLVHELPDGSMVEKKGPAPMDCCLPLWTRSLDVVERFEKAFRKLGGHIVTP